MAALCSHHWLHSPARFCRHSFLIRHQAFPNKCNHQIYKFPQTTEEAPKVVASSEEQSGAVSSVPAETKPSENDQTPNKE